MPSSRQLAVWYTVLAQSLEAGLPLIDVLDASGGPKPRERHAMAESLRHGAPFADAIAEHGEWIPNVDRQLIIAGATTGRLAETLRQLATHREVLSRILRRVWLALLYPAGIVHFGAFALPLKKLVLGSAREYAAAVVGTLLPLWLVLALILIPLWRHAGLRRRLFLFLPGLSRYQRARDLHSLVITLQGYVAAGLPLEQAWPIAGAASGAPRLIALGERLGAAAANGQQPGTLLLAEPDFPVEFGTLYRVGEQTGKLDENLSWIARQCAERADTGLKIVSLLYPALAFLGVAIWVGYTAVAGYSAYLNEILKLME